MGLFVLTLAVFHWGLHYRLEQYESARMNGTAIPHAKMWLGDRSDAVTTDVVRAERGPSFTAVFAVLGLFLSLYVHIFLKSLQISGLQDTRPWIRPPLWTHGHALFFRPPPETILL